MSGEKLKSEVSSFFLRKLELLNSVELVSFEYDFDKNYLAGFGSFDDPSDPVNVIYSVPVKSRHFFFTITEADSRSIASDLAAIQQYCENVSEICTEHSVPTNNKYLLENGYVGYVFVPASTFHPLLEEPVEIAGILYQAIAAIPVSANELEMKRSHGIGKLYEFWRLTNKDCVKF